MARQRLAVGLTPMETRRPVVLHVAQRAEDLGYDAFFLADVLVGVVGSALAAWALWSDARWAVPVTAFTTGGIVYPTLFLVCWVAMVGTGQACLAIMLPPAVLGSFVTWRVWVIDRS